MDRWLVLAALMVLIVAVLLWLIVRARRTSQQSGQGGSVDACDANAFLPSERAVLDSRSDELTRLGFLFHGYCIAEGMVSSISVSNGHGGQSTLTGNHLSEQAGAIWLSDERSILALVTPASVLGGPASAAATISFVSSLSGNERIITSLREAQAVSAVIGPQRSVMNMLTGTLSHQLAVHQTRCEARGPKQAPQLIEYPLLLVQGIMQDNGGHSPEQNAGAMHKASLRDSIVTRLAPMVVQPWVLLVHRLNTLRRRKPKKRANVFAKKSASTRNFNNLAYGHSLTDRQVMRWILGIAIVVLLGAAAFGRLASLLAAILAWGIYLTGRYLAMRFYGYIGLGLRAYVVPCPCIMVDGTSTRALGVWPQIILLLSGSIFGMVIASLILAIPSLMIILDGALAMTAIYLLAFIAFNMLPVYPLVGGMVVDLLLGKRWPTVRMVYAGVSATFLFALGSAIGSFFLVLTAIMVFLGLPPIRRRLPYGIRDSPWLIGINDNVSDCGLSRNDSLLGLAVFTVFLIAFYAAMAMLPVFFRFLLGGIVG